MQKRSEEDENGGRKLVEFVETKVVSLDVIFFRKIGEKL